MCEMLTQRVHPSWYFYISFELWAQDSSRYEHKRISAPALKCKMQQQKQIVCVLPHVSAVCDEGSITVTFVIRLLKVGTRAPLDTVR